MLRLLATFAFLALLLAGLGLYGVLSYVVSQRTHELGIRMALGAPRSSLLAGVMRRGLSLTLVGLALGTPLAFVLTRLLAAVLYGVQSIDPMTFAVTPLALLLTAGAASYLPARRATRVDPATTLRH